MNPDDLKELIFEMFRKQKSRVNGALVGRVIEAEASKLNPKESNLLYNSVLPDLINDDYIADASNQPLGGVSLTQKGYDYIYSGSKSIQDIAQDILDMIAARKLKVNDIITERDLMNYMNSINPVEQGRVQAAAESLVFNGYVTPSTHTVNGLVLTQSGYNHIY